MTSQVRTFARRSLWVLPVWAALLFFATLTEQPDPLTAFADFAAYVTTSQFLLSHLLGSIVGAAIRSIGVIGLMVYLQDSKMMGRAIAGMVATVAGNTLMASTYGVAAFAQPAMGRLFQAGQQNALDFYNQVYAAPTLSTASAQTVRKKNLFSLALPARGHSGWAVSFDRRLCRRARSSAYVSL